MSCFFFFKQKTAYEMRISDWSSDVCSSDLDDHLRGDRGAVVALVPRRGRDADAGTVVEHERRVAPEVEGMLAVDLDVRVAPDPVAFTGLLVEDRHLVVVVGGDAIVVVLELHLAVGGRSEEHTSELQSLMRISYAVFCLKTKTQ